MTPWSHKVKPCSSSGITLNVASWFINFIQPEFLHFGRFSMSTFKKAIRLCFCDPLSVMAFSGWLVSQMASSSSVDLTCYDAMLLPLSLETWLLTSSRLCPLKYKVFISRLCYITSQVYTLVSYSMWVFACSQCGGRHLDVSIFLIHNS